MPNYSIANLPNELITPHNGDWLPIVDTSSGFVAKKIQANNLLKKNVVSAIVATQSSGFVADYYANGTNDRTQINAAITFVNSLGGGIVFLRAGTYLINGDINFDNCSNIIFAGEGKQATIIRVNSSSVFNGLHHSNSSYITIRDLQFDGNKSNFANTYGISGGSTATDCLIENVYVHDAPKSNIQFSGNGCARIKVVNCEISNAGIAGVVYQDTIECGVINSYCHGNTTRDVFHFNSGGGGRDNYVFNSVCESATNAWVLQSHITGSKFIGNVVKNGLAGGIAWDTGFGIIANNHVANISGDDDIAVAGAAVTGGVIANNFATGGGLNGIFVGDNAVNVSVTGNTLTLHSLGGIRIWGAQYCSFVGNSLYNNCQNTGGNNNYSEIWLGQTIQAPSDMANYNTISGNVIKTTLSPYCINMRSQDFNIISNNILQGATISAIQNAGITNSVIANNL